MTRPQYLIFGFLFIVTFLLNSFDACGSETHREGMLDIPYESFAEHRREEVREVIATHSIFRLYHDMKFKVDKSVIKFMMDHPVFLSVTLKAMKIRNYLLKHGDDGMYLFDDRKGIVGKFEMIYSAEGKRYYYGAGGYHGMIFRLLGRGGMFFEFWGVEGSPPVTYVTSNVYTKVDNIVIEVLLKILGPFIMPIMDKKINKFIGETQRLANEITMNPEKVYNVIKKSGHADEKVLEEFKNLVF